MTTSTAAAAQAEFVAFDPERATRQVIRPRGQSLLSRLNDLYVQALTLAVGLLYATSALSGLAAAANQGVGGRLLPEDYGVVPVELGLLAGFGLVGVAVSWMAGRIGPLGIAAKQRHWWYSLAIDRRMLLSRELRRVLWAAAGVGAVVVVPVAIIRGSTPLVFAGQILAGAATGAAILAAAAFAQTHHGNPVTRLVKAAAAAALGSFLFGILQGHWSFALAPGGVLVAAAAAIRNRLAGIPTASLLKAGAAKGHVQAALTVMDTGELGASLAGEGKRSKVTLPGTPRTAFTALLHAEATVLARQPNRILRWALGLAVVPLLASIRTFDSPVILLPALFAAAGFSATAVAGPLWQLRRAPSLDALLPVSRTASRWIHVLLPALLMAVWSTAAAGFFVLAGGFRAELLILGAAAGGGLGAGMLRRAFRQPEDLTKLVYLMQLGRSGPAMLGTRIRGYVLGFFGLLPLALGLLLDAPEFLVLPAVVLNGVLLVSGVVTADRP